MRSADREPSRWMIASIVLVLGWAAIPTELKAQLPGDKAAYASSQNVGGYHDYVDASVFVAAGAACSATDACCAIEQGLAQVNGTSNPYNGNAVIDARGILPPGSGVNLSCSSSPWKDISQNSASVTVLLPAGTIPISSSWVLPNNTRLVGEGALTVNAAGVTLPVTTIQAASNFPAGDMIDIGDPQGSTVLCGAPPPAPPPNCTGIGIEHLTLDGNSVGSVNGIVNTWAQEFNFVNDVALLNISGTGLTVLGQYFVLNNVAQGTAVNSGPYSNIYFSGSGTCVDIHGTYDTRGIYGLTCNNTVGSMGAAIKVDGSNDTIQDVYISGYKGDGILIGSQGYNAQDNLIFNVAGDANLQNLVHVSNSYMGSQPALTFIGIKSGANTTILDDVTGSRLNDRIIGLYILGEAMTGTTGYSRFTTSTAYPAWFVGQAPTQGGSCTGTVLGSLLSVNTGSTGPTLWACVGTTTSSSWQPLSSN
jgi:hypothetical protein